MSAANEWHTYRLDFTFEKLLLQPLEYPPVDGLEDNQVDNSVPRYLMALIRIDCAGR